MTELVDRIIDSLSAHHDRLGSLVEGLSDDQLVGPSAAAEWRVCDVLSHLGSGSEIMLRPLQAAIDGTPAGEGDNQAIWDRWNAASPREQATWFVEHDATMVGALTGLSAEQRGSVKVDLGFLPEPVPLAVAAGMRLNEVAQHAWDVAAGSDTAAVMDADAADALLELYSGPIGFLLGFTAKADALSEPTSVALPGYTLVVSDGVAVVPGEESPTATFTGAPEAAIRLIGGRLTPAYTPAGVEVTGNVTLDDLRRVFPGF